MGLSAVTRGILGGRSSFCINLNEGTSLSEEPTLLGQRCFSSSSKVSPHSCSIACPRTVPLGRDDPCGAGNLGVPHKEMCAAAEGLGTASRACRAGGRWGVPGGLYPCGGHTAASLLLPSWPLGLHGQRTPPFPLRVLLGCIPWVHVLTLALLLTFEMPVLLGIPFAEGHP